MSTVYSILSKNIRDVLFPNIGNPSGGTIIEAGPDLSFHAATYSRINDEVLPLRYGYEDLVTTHADTALYPDHEGLYHAYAVNEPVWKWGRVVENGLTKAAPTSEDGTTVDDLGSGIYKLTSAVENGRARWVFTGGATGATTRYRYIARVEMRNRVGSHGIRIRIGGVNGADISGEIGNSWKVFSESRIGVTSAHQLVDVFFDGAANSVEVRFMMLETAPLDGGTNNDPPSEYVPPLTRKYYATDNGVTVDSVTRVVTEAKGADLDPQPMLVKQGAAENELTYSNNQATIWGQTGLITSTQNQIGLTGEADSCTYLEDTDNAGYAYVYRVLDTTDAGVIKAWVAKQDTAVAQVYLDSLSDNTGGVLFNAETGVATPRITNEPDDVEVVSDGDWWVVLFLLGINTGAKTIRVFPSGGVLGANNINGTATGSCVIGNIEFHANKTIDDVRNLGPIFTEGTAVSVGAITNTYDEANHSNTKGPYLIEFDSSGVDQPVLTAGDDTFLEIVDDHEIDTPLLFHRYDLSGNGRHATLSRADATDCATVIDFEGNTKRIPANVFPFKGSRVVRNLEADSLNIDPDSTDWYIARGTVIQNADGSFRVTATDAICNLLHAMQDLSGRCANALDIKRVNGVGEISIYSGNGYNVEPVEITEQWVRYSKGPKNLAGTNDCIGVSLAISGDIVDIRFPQRELVTDQSNQAPSEFVEPNDSCCSVEDVAIQCFNKHNSLYVDGDGVVHEGYGKDIYSWNRSTESNNYDAWGKINGATNSGNEISFPADGAASIWDAAIGSISENNSQGVDLKGAVGGEKIRLRLWDAVSGSHYGADITLTTEYVRYFQDNITLGAVNMNFGVYQADGTAKTFYMRNHQYEHQPQSTTYIPTFGSVEIRYGPTLEGSTKQLIDPDVLVGFVPEEAHENLCADSNDITQTSWTKSNSIPLNYESFIPTSNGGGVYSLLTSVEGESYTFHFKIKSDTNRATIRAQYQNSASGDSTDIAVTTEYVYHEFTVLGKIGGGSIAFGVYDVAISDWENIYIKDVNITHKAYPLSHVYTNGAAATREEDHAETPYPSTLVNDAVFSADTYMERHHAGEQRDILFTNLNGSTSNRVLMYASSARSAGIQKRISSVGYNSTTPNSTLYAVKQRIIGTISSVDGVSNTVDGVVGGLDANTDDVGGSFTSMRIGRPNFFNGGISNVKVTRLNAGKVLRLTDGINAVNMPLLGDELVTNGTFDTDVSGWTENNSTLTQDADRLKVVVTTGYGSGNQTISVTSGATLRFEVDMTDDTGEARFHIYDNIGAAYILSNQTVSMVEFVSPSSEIEIRLRGGATIGDIVYFDNVSLREVTAIGEHTAGVAFSNGTPERVTNSGFSSDISGWPAVGYASDAIWKNGVLNVTKNNTTWGSVTSSTGTVAQIYAGETITLSADIVDRSGTYTVKASLRDGAGGSNIIECESDSTGTISVTGKMVANVVDPRVHISIQTSAGSAWLDLDNISIKSNFGQMALALDGEWSEDTDYDGTLGEGDIDVGIDAREIKRLNVTDLDTQKTILGYVPIVAPVIPLVLGTLDFSSIINSAFTGIL